MDFLKPIVSYTAWTPWVWHQQHTLYCRHELSNNGSIVKTEWSESNQDSQPATSTQGVNPSRDVSGFALRYVANLAL